LIEGFRSVHDARQHSIVGAHFTMAFGCAAVELDVYTSHVANVAASSPPIAFSCKYAMLGADDEDDTAYVFLVPDQGYSEISLLHDRLYTGPLQANLRLDLPYIPHITIGSLRSRIEAKALCDELNHQGLSIDGRLNTLSVGAIERAKFSTFSEHALAAACVGQPNRALQRTEKPLCGFPSAEF